MNIINKPILKRLIKVFILFVTALIISSCSKDGSFIASWQRVDTGLHLRLSNIFFFNDTGVVLGRSESVGDFHSVILKSYNAGKSWDTINFPIGFPAGAGFNNIYALNSDTLFASSQQYILISYDGGRNWDNVDPSLCSGGCSFGNLYFKNIDTGFISIGGTILKTYNRAKNFSIVYDNSSTALVGHLQFLANKVGYASWGDYHDGSNYGYIIKSLDGGNSWNELPFKFNYITDMYFLDEKLGFVFTFNGELYKTKNGGNSWSLVSNKLGLANYPYSFFSNEFDGFYCNKNCIYHTENGGISWAKEYIGNSDSIYFRGLSFINPSIGYAITDNGTILKRNR